ncbi:universal stress protein [Micrococcales bacterium 31B]|nr:universal stress protein [Micrococcales bacterium 31B]
MTVVLGYVPSQVGRSALQAALAAAIERAEPLLVINTTRNPDDPGSRLATGADLEALHAILESSGVEYEVRQFVSESTAADDVLSAAEERNASLIVVGVRRRDRLGKILLGATAQSILLDAACPVLSVKVKDHS